ncbi:MAG: hypothetical protein BGO10_05955 [Chlamydia sp. 32-24]|nr:MAG: hypothetical protein BGO10_05955 [Chlamydia sp. 32-24]
MAQGFRRTPKFYDGTELTSRTVSQLLPGILEKIGEVYQDRPDLILASWPDIIGSKLAPMTKAISFKEGVLTIKVKNSSLHSLLSQYEKKRLLKLLQEKFPKVPIINILFRIG